MQQVHSRLEQSIQLDYLRRYVKVCSLKRHRDAIQHMHALCSPQQHHHQHVPRMSVKESLLDAGFAAAIHHQGLLLQQEHELLQLWLGLLLTDIALHHLGLPATA
jgi:hypothetical protein